MAEPWLLWGGCRRTMMIIVKAPCSNILLSFTALTRSMCWWGCLYYVTWHAAGLQEILVEYKIVYIQAQHQQVFCNRSRNGCPTPAGRLLKSSADVCDFSLAVLVGDLYTAEAGLCHSLRELGMMPFKSRLWQQFGTNVTIWDKLLSFSILLNKASNRFCSWLAKMLWLNNVYQPWQQFLHRYCQGPACHSPCSMCRNQYLSPPLSLCNIIKLPRLKCWLWVRRWMLFATPQYYQLVLY